MGRSAGGGDEVRNGFWSMVPWEVKAVAGVAAVAAGGFALTLSVESTRKQNDLKLASNHGRRIHVASGDLYVVHVEGPKDTGAVTRPVVILDAGLGSWSLEYVHLIEELKKYTSIVAFDRLGMGLSSFSPSKNRLNDQADGLKQALEYLDLEGPFIYVANTIAAPFANAYIRKHMHKIFGVLYIDAVNKHSLKYLHTYVDMTPWTPSFPYLSVKTMAYTGLLRREVTQGKISYANPSRYRSGDEKQLIAIACKPSYHTSVELDLQAVREVYGVGSKSSPKSSDNEGRGWLGNIPVSVVLSDNTKYLSGEEKNQRLRAIEAQKQSLTFSSDSKFKMIETIDKFRIWKDRDTLTKEILALISRADERRKAFWGM